MRLSILALAPLLLALASCAALPPPDSAPPLIRGKRVQRQMTQTATPIAAPAENVSVRALVVEHSLIPHHPRELPALLQDKAKTASMLIASEWFEGALKAEGELAHSTPAGLSLVGATDSERSQLYRIGITGSTGMFRYGANLKSAGDAFLGQQDQAVREVWGEWGRGPITLRTTVGERWNNVHRDPFRPRITTMEQRTALTMQMQASGPAFTMSYARAASSSSLEPAGTVPTRNLSDTLEASVSLMRARWNAKLFSAYSLVSDRLGTADTAGLTHGMQASYRASPLLTIAPSLSFREDRQRWSGTLVDTPSASLSLTYAPQQAMSVTAFGLYSRAHSTDGLINTSTYNLKSVVTWTTFQADGLTTAISFDAGYTAALDVSPTGRSTEDLSGLVRLQLIGY